MDHCSPAVVRLWAPIAAVATIIGLHACPAYADAHMWVPTDAIYKINSTYINLQSLARAINCTAQ